MRVYCKPHISCVLNPLGETRGRESARIDFVQTSFATGWEPDLSGEVIAYYLRLMFTTTHYKIWHSRLQTYKVGYLAWFY